MLGRLDDQLDSDDYVRRTQCTLPSVLTGEPVRGMQANAPQLRQDYAPATHPHLLTFNNVVGARPPLTRDSVRVPLRDCVRSLVNDWSLAFVDLANRGDVAAQALVAQMFLSSRGYGMIQPDRNKGIHWLMTAVDSGDADARELAKKLAPKELAAHTKTQQQPHDEHDATTTHT